MTLVLDLESNAVIFGGALGRTVSFFLPEEGVILSKTEESRRKGDCVFPVGFDLDVSGLTDLPFRGSVAYDAGSLSEVSLVGDDFDATSLGDCDFAV